MIMIYFETSTVCADTLILTQMLYVHTEYIYITHTHTHTHIHALLLYKRLENIPQKSNNDHLSINRFLFCPLFFYAFSYF
jgi:hypothetical protein